MAASAVSSVKEVSDVTAFEISEFMHCTVSEIQSFADVTIKMYFRWLFSTD